MAQEEVTFELATSESLPEEQGLTDLINRVYRVSEDGLWKDATFQRTCAEEVSDLIRKGEIVLARAGTSRVVLGCVQSRMLDEKPTTGSFGMLVVDPDQRNRGIGKRLIEEAEKLARSRGADTMQVRQPPPKMPCRFLLCFPALLPTMSLPTFLRSLSSSWSFSIPRTGSRRTRPGSPSGTLSSAT